MCIYIYTYVYIDVSICRYIYIYVSIHIYIYFTINSDHSLVWELSDFFPAKLYLWHAIGKCNPSLPEALAVALTRQEYTIPPGRRTQHCLREKSRSQQSWRIPQTGWFTMEYPNLIWMLSGHPYFRKHVSVQY